MKKTSKILPILAAALTCVALFGSCDYWKEDFYKNGGDTVSSGGSGSGSSGSGTGTSSGSGSSGGTTSTSGTGTFAFKASAANPISVNGGQYQLCIINGNSSSGSITLAQGGASPNLTGTYSSAVSMAAAISGDATFEGSVDATFEGISGTRRVTVTGDTLTIVWEGTSFTATAVPAVTSGYTAVFKAGSASANPQDGDVVGIFAFFYPDNTWTFSTGFKAGNATYYITDGTSTYSITSGDFTSGKMSMVWPALSGQASQNFSGDDPYTGDVVITGGKF
ncbi:MAG: hypothetical protein K6G18_10370, partial [Treponema sp.]|nr:hypothetical protein [Treponema sp.]